MDRSVKTAIHWLSAIGFLSYVIFFKSCANTSSPPEGGPKDTIPPVIVKCTPLENSTNHLMLPKQSSVTIEFNEYVTVKDANKNIFLSPPHKKPPTFKIKGKSVVISFPDTLNANQTYSLSLGEAIKDNNEGNQFPPFCISFSTGDHIDSMFVSGTILEASTMLPMKGMKVLFHTDKSDSAIFKVLPKAAALSDAWGYFVVRNLPTDTSYRVYAIEDQNNNNLYDPESERVAFLDSIIVASDVMQSTSKELAILDMKDTANCLSRPSKISLSMFKEMNTKQFLRNKARDGRRHMYITFAAPYPQIDSIIIDGIPTEKLIFEKNFYNDSISIWINDQGGVHDTLQMRVAYMKTDDTLMTLVPVIDTLKMIRPKGKMVENRIGEMVEVPDTVAGYKVDASPDKIDYDGILISFESPMIITPFDSIRLTQKNTREQVSKVSFTVEQDTADIKQYVLRLTEKLKVGFEYTLKIPDSLFMDIDGIYCDSLEKKFSLPTDESLSSLCIEANNVNERYIVELVDEKRTKIFRSYSIDTASVLQFPYLKAGKYSIRITEDKNGNGQIDPGSVLEHRQPEKVLLLKVGKSLGNDAYILEIPEKMELTQTIDIGELFK